MSADANVDDAIRSNNKTTRLEKIDVAYVYVSRDNKPLIKRRLCVVKPEDELHFTYLYFEKKFYIIHCENKSIFKKISVLK